MWVALAIPLASSSCSAEALARVKAHNHVMLNKVVLPIHYFFMNCLCIWCLPAILGVRCSVFTAGTRLCPGSFCRNLLKCLKLKRVLSSSE